MSRRSDATEREPDQRGGEHGFVMVWVGIVLVVLIGVAAFAVDLVHAYVVGQQAQNAADAAATAGAAQIPNDIPCAQSGHAVATAKDLATKNLTDDNLTVAPGDIEAHCTGPNEMTVTVKNKFDTWFARALGIDDLTVHRQAVGQYDATLAMGSPANNLGDVPGDSCTDLQIPSGLCVTVSGNAQQDLFAQIQGPDTDKVSGNAYSTNFCNNGATPPTPIPDGCTAVGAGGNAEFDPTTGGDETFFVQNDAPGSALTVAVYDGGFVDTGGFCNPIAWSIDTANLPSPTRYGNGPGQSQYCAGDRKQKGANPCTDCTSMDTRFDVLDPDGNAISGCSTGDIPGVFPKPVGDPTSPLVLTPTEAKYFQHWQPICTISPTDLNRRTYRVRVHSAQGQGTNNFSLLALHGVGSTPTPGTDLSIATHEKLPLFANKPNGNPGSFYLARVPPSSEPRTLTLDFFDLGDSANGQGNCVGGVVPPPGGCPSTGTIHIHPDGFGDFSNCTITTPVGGFNANGLNTGPPWGNQGSSQSCSFHYDRTTWNGQWVTIKVQIPVAPGYGCLNFNDFQQCWIKIDLVPDFGTWPLSDATTWNASINGAPVRLTG